jgi:flagellar hook-basal body complex protein FliE
MIEQFSAGMPQVSQPAATAHRDRQSQPEQDENSGSFDDLLSKAGDRQPQKNDKNDADAAAEKPSVTSRVADALPKAVFELSAALKGVPDQSQPSKVQFTVLGEPLKLVGKADQVERQSEVALAKLVEKIKQAGKVEMPDAEPVNANENLQMPLTASDELSLLLGLTKEVDGKSSRKDALEKAERKTDDDVEPTDAAGDKIDIADGDPMMIVIDTSKGGKDDRPQDDSASRASIVRVESANGRGRSVDIELQDLNGAQRQDSAKTSSAPKIETATVLEARRYLGFSTETNGTVLAAAINADPTWTEALQSAQRADVRPLASTVTEVNTLKLQMNPGDLGSMVASLKLKGEELTVELRVTTVEAYHRLVADHDDIVKSLQDQGFSIDKVTVQLNAIDRTDTGNRDMSRQQEQDQAQREAEAERERQDGKSSRNDQDEQQRRATAGEYAEGGSVDGRSDTGRSGNLYL